MKSTKFYLFFLLLIFVGCENIGTSKFEGVAKGLESQEKTNPDLVQAPSGIEIFTSSSFLLADKVNLRISGTRAGDTIKIYTDNCTTEVGSGVANGTTTDILISSLSVGSHSFRAKSSNLSGDQISDCSTATVSYIRLSMPSAIEIVTPAPSSLLADKVKLRVSGTRAGDTIKIYSDNCTTEVGSGVAAGNNVDIETSSLILGLHSFRAKAFNGEDQISDCTTALVNYTRLSMPSAIEIVTPAPSSLLADKVKLRVSGTRAGDTIKIYSDNCTTEVGSGIASGTSIDIITSSLNLGLHSFRAKASKTGNQFSDCSTAEVNYTRLSMPSAIEIITPAPTADFVDKIKLKISGTRAGDTIKIYTEDCSNLVGSEVASGTTVDITTSSLNVGLNSLKAKAVKGADQISDCSAAVVTYTRALCPENYILIKANNDVETYADFCVAKYEMRCSGTNCQGDPGPDAVAASLSDGKAWVNIDNKNAKVACQNLDGIYNLQNKFGLISNPEWMTIARNIEKNGSNWSTGVAGDIVNDPSNHLNTGWTLANTIAAPNSKDENLYNTVANTGASTGTFKYKRTHSITPAGEIWDLAGNVYELIDWKVNGKKAQMLNFVSGSWIDFIDLTLDNGINDEMKKSTYSPFYENLTGANSNIGRYNPGNNGAGGFGMRGGYWNFNSSSRAGIYTLNLLQLDTYKTGYIGFRCVYRP